VSLISFDVKGAYNGDCKERLLQRMKARGIPEKLLRWIEAFCSERTVTIQINGQSSEVINDALDWERRSGATFEAEKTAIIDSPANRASVNIGAQSEVSWKAPRTIQVPGASGSQCCSCSSGRRRRYPSEAHLLG
jgi:hypothetical protein